MQAGVAVRVHLFFPTNEFQLTEECWPTAVTLSYRGLTAQLDPYPFSTNWRISPDSAVVNIRPEDLIAFQLLGVEVR
jgi:hypothetical protein